jgi:hypothetical protein
MNYQQGGDKKIRKKQRVSKKAFGLKKGKLKERSVFTQLSKKF